MSTISIGATIKRLRREKDITQEQLAEYLGITSRAVSQWECGRTAPDISQLPVLANLFEVSADVLLGIDITQKEQRISELLKMAEKEQFSGYFKEAAAILREALHEFPNSHKIMAALMACSYREADEEENKDRQTQLRQEVISLGERILSDSTDDEVRYSAIQHLCYTYSRTGEKEKAAAIAKKMPERFLSAQTLLATIYTGAERFRLLQEELLMTVSSNLYCEMCFNNRRLENGCTPYTNQEYLEILKKYLAILDIVFEDRNYGFCTQLAGRTQLSMAWCYMQEKQYAMAVSCLQEAQKLSTWWDTSYDPAKTYTCLLFRGMEFGEVHHNDPENECQYQLNQMNQPVFDPVRDTAEFTAVVEALKPYAGKREHGRQAL